MACEIRIGTSGWNYKHWREIFYPIDLPATKQLLFYAGRFNTVEINNTFYALPTEKAVKNWYSIAPENFCFAVKASRYLTHVKKLNDSEDALRRFLEVVEHLEEKLGPILFQFPPNWRINLERLRQFIQILPRSHTYIFEFRHESWYAPAVYQLLRDFNAVFCLFDRERNASPLEITSDQIYIRFHGSGFPYEGNYVRELLEPWATRIEEWKRFAKKIYIYFNNDWRGFALQNALDLQNMISTQRTTTRSSA